MITSVFLDLLVTRVVVRDPAVGSNDLVQLADHLCEALEDGEMDPCFAEDGRLLLRPSDPLARYTNTLMEYSNRLEEPHALLIGPHLSWNYSPFSPMDSMTPIRLEGATGIKFDIIYERNGHKLKIPLPAENLIRHGTVRFKYPITKEDRTYHGKKPTFQELNEHGQFNPKKLVLSSLLS